MDPTLFRLAAFALAALTVMTVVKTIVNGVLRLADKQREQREHLDAPRARLVEERLDRMETAIDAVAIELERIGEHQRFSAQLAAGAVPKATVADSDELSGRARP